MEKYLGIYKAPSFDDRKIIKCGQSAIFKTNLDSVENRSFRLFFTGDTCVHYTWKCESDCQVMYGKIDDALDCENALGARYCLRLDGCNYPKIIYKKLTSEVDLGYLPESVFKGDVWKPILSYLPLVNYTDNYKFGIWASAEGVKIAENGYLKMTLEVRFAKENVNPHDVTPPADISHVINFKEGSYEWEKIENEIVIPKDKTVSVCVFIEGENFEGTLYLERPFIEASNGFNILPDFAPSTSQKSAYNWAGQNISRTEWPEFELKANGEIFYSGQIFERCHRNSECEINIPDGALKNGDNEFEIKLITSHRDAPPYAIGEVALIEEPKNAFDVISCPEVATAGKPFSVLIKVNEPIKIALNSDHIEKFDDEEFVFEKSGLYALRFICNSVVNDLTFTLESSQYNAVCTLKRCVEKPFDDGVITGTSDAVYIRQSEPEMENFFKFYVSSQLGDLLIFRPVYRWSGTRKYCPEIFSKYVPLLNKMGMKYANMTDGREPAGYCSNPPIEDMQKTQNGIESGFLGRQKHERDGSYNYWSERSMKSYEAELNSDLMLRNFINNPDTTSHASASPKEVYYHGNKRVYYRSENMPDDMQGMRNYAVSKLSESRYNNTRHTGPSIMFKYLYDSGYDWVGAELMYGPLEPVVAAMRGAYRSYNKIGGFGAHHALQWSSSPHDSEAKYRRYRLALYLSYMHGISEINLEEGLVHLEEYFSAHNRFSPACKAYIKSQQDFNRYIKSHTRSGEFYAPFAFIHGRCDGFSAFSRTRVWGNDNFRFCDAERSWYILNTFYPKSVIDGIYRHHPDETKPLGFYTGTPRGNTDIIPIEKPRFEPYKAICFTGYNMAVSSDLDALLSYVKNGGTLILCWPHLSKTTDRKSIENGKFEYIDHPLCDYLASSKEFVEDSYRGERITVCPDIKADDVIATTDSGIPLAAIKFIGNGRVFFINAEEYPANACVRPIYETIIYSVSDDINAEEKTYIRCGEDVGFTIFDQADGSRHIYVLAVDWYNGPDKIRSAKLKIGGKYHDISVPFGSMLKIVTKGDVAAWSENEDVEILLISSDIVTLQGYGKQIVHFVLGGEHITREIDFTKKPLRAIKL